DDVLRAARVLEEARRARAVRRKILLAKRPRPVRRSRALGNRLVRRARRGDPGPRYRHLPLGSTSRRFSTRRERARRAATLGRTRSVVVTETASRSISKRS